MMMSTKKIKPHYVNNKEFSQAVVDYVQEAQRAKELNYNYEPQIPNYVADCFLKIANGLSRKPNFSGYSFRDEMVMDGVENCLKAIHNYDIDAATRSGNPNAFGYFTQIIYYAFLRRIQKEQRQQDIKIKYMTSAGVESFIDLNADDANNHMGMDFIDKLRSQIDEMKDLDKAVEEFIIEQRQKEKPRHTKLADSNLEEFIHE
jgi:hypothetical protein